ncbi:Short transmembrane mitochondrial protein 1 [Bienertia sinuspersici]
MGIIRTSFVFSMGAIWGIYLAQSYNVPDVKKCADNFLYKAKRIEEMHRKTTKSSEKDKI